MEKVNSTPGKTLPKLPFGSYVSGLLGFYFSLDTTHFQRKQGRIQGVCLAVMTGPFVPQVLIIKADDKISNAVIAGL